MDLVERRYLPVFWFRKLMRPKREGEKRYILFASKEKKTKSDPGYLWALIRPLLKHFYYSEFIVEERVAIETPQGSLCWVSVGDYRTIGTFSGPRGLRLAKKTVRALNRTPLGIAVVQEVDERGLLVISSVHRYFTHMASHQISDKHNKERKFDITEEDNAAAAITYYCQLQEDVEASLTQEIERAAERAKIDRRTSRLFADPAVSERIERANRFAKLLERGQFDKIEIEMKQRQDEEAKIMAEQRRQKSRVMSKRARKTIDSLTTPRDN